MHIKVSCFDLWWQKLSTNCAKNPGVEERCYLYEFLLAWVFSSCFWQLTGITALPAIPFDSFSSLWSRWRASVTRLREKAKTTFPRLERAKTRWIGTQSTVLRGSARSVHDRKSASNNESVWCNAIYNYLWNLLIARAIISLTVVNSLAVQSTQWWYDVWSKWEYRSRPAEKRQETLRQNLYISQFQAWSVVSPHSHSQSGTPKSSST